MADSGNADFTSVIVPETFVPGKPLTGSRRMLRDHCADLYNTVQSWNDHIIKGLPIIRQIGDTVQNKISNAADTNSENFDSILQQLSDKLAEEISCLKSEVALMLSIKEKIKAVCDLMNKEQDRSTEGVNIKEFIPFQSWPVSRFYEKAQIVAAMHAKETGLKESVAAEICQQMDRDKVKFFYLCWKYRPYTPPDDVLLSIVVECGLKSL